MQLGKEGDVNVQLAVAISCTVVGGGHVGSDEDREGDWRWRGEATGRGWEARVRVDGLRAHLFGRGWADAYVHLARATSHP